MSLFPWSHKATSRIFINPQTTKGVHTRASPPQWLIKALGIRPEYLLTHLSCSAPAQSAHHCSLHANPASSRGKRSPPEIKEPTVSLANKPKRPQRGSLNSDLASPIRATSQQSKSVSRSNSSTMVHLLPAQLHHPAAERNPLIPDC